MLTTRGLLTVSIAAGGAGVLAIALIAWPAYSETRQIDRRIAEIRHKSDDVVAQEAALARIRGEVVALERRVAEELKTIPEAPDVADLASSLSIEAKSGELLDQEFVTSSHRETDVGAAGTRSLPVTVKLEASFDFVFRLLQRVESMDRLVRVTRVVIEGGRPLDGDAGMLAATLELQAIYEPPAEGEGR